jgi:Fe-S-cluster containining protein
MNGTKEFENGLAAKIVEIGFSCIRCGECCRGGSGDDNLVMVTPGEIRAISDFCGLSKDEVAEPYPESVELPGGRSVTFGHVLQRPCGDCRFFSSSLCMVYQVRPSICRTYPFMLDGDELRVFPCRGLGKPLAEEGAFRIAHDLVRRRAIEEEELTQIRAIFADLPPRSGRFIIDAEGVSER